jgi:hypothetical protein
VGEAAVALLRERPWPLTGVAAVGAATVVSLILLTLSGSVRGEVERVWLFLLAPLAVAAVLRLSWRSLIPMLLLQAVQTLLMAATLAPLVRPF